MSELLSQKINRILSARVEKQRKLTDIPDAPVIGMADQRLRQKLERLERDTVASARRGTLNEVNDSVLSAGRFVAGVATGLPALVLDEAARGENSGGFGEVGDRVNDALGSAADWLIEQGGEADELLRSRMSDVSRYNEEIVQERIAADSARNLAQAEQEIANGSSEFAAGARRVGRNIADGFQETISNPTYLANQLAAQAPTLAMGPLANAAARASIPARAVAGGTAAQNAAVRAGLPNAVAARSNAARTALEELRSGAARHYMGLGTAGMESSALYAQIGQEIEQAPLEVLAQKYPGVWEQLEQQVPEAEIRQGLRQEVGGRAAALLAPVAYGAGRMTAGLELDPLMAGSLRNSSAALPAAIIEAGARTGGEMIEEGIQGGSSELLGNLSERISSEDAGTDLLAGVGEAVGQGAAVGGPFSAALASPALAAAAATDAVTGVKEGFAGALAQADKISARRQEKIQAEAQTQAAEAQAARAQAATVATAAVAERAKAAPETSAAELAQPIDNEPTLDESTKKLLTGSRLEALAQAVPLLQKYHEDIAALPEDAPELAQKGMEVMTLAVFATKTARQLENHREKTLLPALQAATTSEEKTALTEEITAINTLLENADLVEQREEVEAALKGGIPMAEALFKQLEATPEIATEILARPENRQRLETVRELAQSRPELVSSAAAEGLLSLHMRMPEGMQLRAEEVETLELVRDVAKIREEHAAATDALPKSGAQVRSEVYFTGMDAKRPSLDQFLSRVVRARRLGRTEEAQRELNRLKGFAQHLSNKAKDFKGALETSAESGEVVNLPKYKRVNQDNSLSKEAAWVKAGFSEGLVQQVAVDAKAARDLVKRLEGKRTVPQSKPAAAAVAAPTQDDLVAQANALMAQSAAEQGIELEENELEPGIDFEKDGPASEKDMTKALGMSDDAYLKAIGGDVETLPEAAEALVEGLEDEELPKNTTRIGQVNDSIELRAAGNHLYAVEAGKVVGKLAVHKKGTELAVAQGKQGQGIGKALMRELLIRNPMAPAGELTPSAAATRNKVRAQLRAERAPAKTEPREYNPLRDLVEQAGGISRAEAKRMGVTGAALEAYPEDGASLAQLSETMVNDGYFADANEATDSRVWEMVEESAEGIPHGPLDDPKMADILAERRAEQRDDSKPTMADRFAGVIQTLQGVANPFLKAFSLDPRSESRLAQNPMFIQELIELLEKAKGGNRKDLLAVRKLIPHVLPSQIDGLHAVLTKMLPQLVDQLNDTANQLLDEKGNRKQTLREALAAREPGTSWVFANRMGMSVMGWNQSKRTPRLEYNTQVANAMALAAVNWVMATINEPIELDMEYLWKEYPYGIPEEIRQAYSTMHGFIQPARGMAADIEALLGLTRNKGESKFFTDGLTKSLALDTIRAMEELGMLEVKTIRKSPSGFETETFLGLRNTPAHAELKALRKMLGSSTLISRTFLPTRADAPVFGKPMKTRETKIRGVDRNLSKEQEKQLNKKNAAPKFVNESFYAFRQALGEPFLDLFGYVVEPDGAENVWQEDYLVQQRGINHGLESADQLMGELYEEWRNAAEEAGTELKDTPMYRNHFVASNGRTMEYGTGAQANKQLREFESSNKAVVDLSTDDVTRPVVQAYYLSLAQALGIKTELQRNAAAITAVRDWLTQPAYAKLVGQVDESGTYTPGLIQRLMDSGTEGTAQDAEALRNETMQALKVLLASEGPTSFRAVHALLTHSNLLKARAEGKANEFTTYLGFELDGKTNGMINALYQFGLAAKGLTPEIIEQLAMGGVFIGDQGEMTISKAAEANGGQFLDLYQQAADTLSQMLSGPVHHSPELLAGLSMLRMAGQVSGDENKGWTIKRPIAKTALMVTTYFSGPRGMASAQANEIMDNVYRQLTDAALRDETVPKELADNLTVLMSRVWDKKAEMWVSIRPPKFKVVPNRVKFEQQHYQALVDNLLLDGGISGLLREAIEKQMASVLSTFSQVRDAAGMQMQAADLVYKIRYEALRQQRLKEGTLLHADHPLSQEDEESVLKSVRSLVPAYSMPWGKNTEEGEGLYPGEKDFNGTFTPPAQKQGTKRNRLKAQNFVQGMALDINVRQLSNPGVRPAPLSNIAAGDALMMFYLMMDKPEGTLDVYDGWEVSIDQLFERALEANEAVRKTYEHNMLGSVVDSFKRTFSSLDMTELNKLSIDDITNFLRDNRLASPKQLKYPKIARQVFNEYWASEPAMLQASLDRALETSNEARKEIEARGSTIDQMSGGERPSVRKPTEAVAAPSEELSNELSKLWTSGDKALLMNSSQLRDLLKNFQFKNKVHRFVVNQVMHLVPDDLVVLAGIPAQLLPLVQKLYPEEAAKLGNKFSSKGMLIGNHMFLATPSEETLVHEVVHAATALLIQKFFNDPKTKLLTSAQKESIRQLLELAKEFVTLKRSDNEEAFHAAQYEVAGWLRQERPAEAVMEFVAWAMTNQDVRNRLQHISAVARLKAIAKTVKETVRKLLGLPKNTSMDSFLDQVTFNFHQLARRPAVASTMAEIRALHQRLPAETDTAHELHLDQVAESLAPLITRSTELSSNVQEAAQQAGYFAFSQKLRRDLGVEAGLAGFDMTPKQVHAFGSVLAVMDSNLQLDGVTLNQMQALYEQAASKVTPRDLMDNPESTAVADIEQGKQRHAYLFGQGTQLTDAKDRNLHLPMFVALSQSHPAVRAALAQVAVREKQAWGNTLNERLRQGVTRSVDWVSDRTARVSRNANGKTALDTLVNRLADMQQRTAREAVHRKTFVDRADEFLRDSIESTSKTAASWLESKADTTFKGKVASIASRSLGFLDRSKAPMQGEALMSVLNQTVKWDPLLKLAAEFMGNLPSTKDMNQWLNKTKYLVSRARQQIRERVPAEVKGFFSQPLSKETWASLYRSAAETDLQSVLFTHSVEEIRGMVKDPAKLDAAIQKLGQALKRQQYDLMVDAEQLARYMVHKSVAPKFMNPDAIVDLGMKEESNEDRSTYVGQVSSLVSLLALKQLAATDLEQLGQLLDTETEAMQKTLVLMNNLVTSELAKPGYEEHKYNWVKGYTPRSVDPRSTVVLATPEQAKELLLKGYKKVANYQGDASTPSSDLAYYAVKYVGGQATFVQGALQTVEGSISGVHTMKGVMLASGVSTYIASEKIVPDIAVMQQAIPAAARRMIAIRDKTGQVVAYQRLLDPKIVSEHVHGKDNLADALGVWMGRQAEEMLAHRFNEQVADLIHQNWLDGKAKGDEKSYVAVNFNRRYSSSWEGLPEEIKQYLREKFDGPVMVRRDLVDNSLGYRMPSVADVFSEQSDLSPKTQKAIRDVAITVFGKQAYRVLLTAERAIQGGVGTAKDIIVVRSGVVALANIIANVFQLMAAGIPLWRIPVLMARAAQETELYLRNEAKVTKLKLQLATTQDQAEITRWQREMEQLLAVQRKMSIYPLIEAGELPTVSEGLTEHAEYTTMGDLAQWAEEKAKNFPPGVVTAAKYLMINRDTALYQGLNRMIQMGDFTAKKVLFDHLRSKGSTQAEALERISEAFVNYNRNAGRTRDYLESMGITWFWNYKIRIQKIILQMLRDNPLHFLLSIGTAGLAGSDSLFTSSAPMTNWSYSVGYDQFFGAPSAHLWHQIAP